MAVTVFAALLALAAGDGAGTVVLVAAAVLAGQLSIGWSNDRLDVRRDRLAGRADKPLAAAVLGLRAADVAIGISVVATVALSLSLGVRPGVVHLVAVAFGWLYNVVLKRTWWSWLPYAAAFGALPAVATLAGPGHPAPAGWVIAAGALLGVTAHLLNTLPDLEDDLRSGVRGFPQRLGAARSLALASGLLLVASLVVVLGPPGAPRTASWVGLGVNVVAAVGGLVHQRGRPPSRTSFLGIIVVVAVDLVLLLTVRHLTTG